MSKILNLKSLLLQVALVEIILNLTRGELLFVIEVYRHGARYPESDNQFWHDPANLYRGGELTSVGMRQHYNLGSQLREEYIAEQNFLSENFNNTEMYIYSTDYNRTLMSATSHLFGLYGIDLGPNLPYGINFSLTIPPFKDIQPVDIGLEALPDHYQPIPIHSQPTKYDRFFFFWDLCPNFDGLYNKFLKQNPSLVNHMTNDFANTYQIAANAFNTSIKNVNFNTIYDLVDVLYSYMYLGQPFPPGITDEVWRNLTFLDTMYWFTSYGPKDINNMATTKLFQQFIMYLDSSIQQDQSANSNGFKWASYSAHDMNLVQIMIALNISNYQCQMDLFYNGSTDAINCEPRPLYAASLILELHKQNNEYQVAIRSNGKYVYLCNTYNIYCSYSEFKSRLEHQMTTEEFYERKCKVNGSFFHQYINGMKQFNIWVILCTVQFIVLVLLIVYIICKKSKKNKKLKYANEQLYKQIQNQQQVELINRETIANL